MAAIGWGFGRSVLFPVKRRGFGEVGQLDSKKPSVTQRSIKLIYGRIIRQLSIGNIFVSGTIGYSPRRRRRR
jgi:hypothetical protein